MNEPTRFVRPDQSIDSSSHGSRLTRLTVSSSNHSTALDVVCPKQGSNLSGAKCHLFRHEPSLWLHRSLPPQLGVRDFATASQSRARLRVWDLGVEVPYLDCAIGEENSERIVCCRTCDVDRGRRQVDDVGRHGRRDVLGSERGDEETLCWSTWHVECVWAMIWPRKQIELLTAIDDGDRAGVFGNRESRSKGVPGEAASLNRVWVVSAKTDGGWLRTLAE